MSIKLNKNQEIAINHNKGAMMVLSGPGSGKTSVITRRIKNLIENYNVNPKDILVITFTKAAAEEMKNRFFKLASYNQVYFGTFHSYFFKIIRNIYNYTLDNIITEIEKINIIKKILSNLNIDFRFEEDEILQNILNEISLVKNELILIENFDSICINPNQFRQIYFEYENQKKQLKKIDFDDMLINCYEILKQDINIRNFWKNQYKYILIDEFQDSATRF